MTAPTVSASALSKSFGRQRAVDQVDLSVRPGVTGLLGPNGAGKTTLLRLLATVLAPDSGRLSILGRDPADAQSRIEIRRRLGYLPQDAGFPRSFTAFEAIDYIAILKEWNDRRSRHDEVRRVLAEVGLTDVSGTKVRALSGGMRRRLGLAQALLGTPDFVVLDEPTVGLDPEQRLRFREFVSTAGSHGAVLLSTHQTEDVAALCSHVVVMHAGRVLWSGDVPGLAATANGRVWVDSRRDPRAVAAWRLGNGLVHHVGTPPVGAQVVEPSIEDAYLLMLRSAEAATLTAAGVRA